MIAAVAVGKNFAGDSAAMSSGARTGIFHRSLESSLAAAAASRLLGLAQEQVAHALGIASMQFMRDDGGRPRNYDLRGIYAGFSAEAPLGDALRAEGASRARRAIRRESSDLLNLLRLAEYDRDKILDGLGQLHRQCDAL